MLSSVLEDTYQQALSTTAIDEQANLSRNLTFLSHQMVLLMRSLNIPFCRCKPCIEHLETESINVTNNFVPPEIVGLPNDHCGTSMDLQRLNGMDPTDSVQALLAKATGASMGEDQMGSEGLDRRHKYYTTRKERYEIAKCGKIYGVQVAAKRYNIPPYAVRYYVNTMARSLKHVNETDAMGNVMIPSCSTSNAGRLHNNDGSMLTKDSKRYARKGRPLLLGEELDKKLLDHMIKLEQSNPGQISSVSRALHDAQTFLHENAPGLLVEDGGTLKLGYSWAISMLRRVIERSKEMEKPGKCIPVPVSQDPGKNVVFKA